MPVAGEDLVRDDNFLLATPPVLMSPDVAPVEEVCHWHHGDSQTFDERLSTDDWEEGVGGSGGEKTVLEAT